MRGEITGNAAAGGGRTRSCLSSAAVLSISGEETVKQKKQIHLQPFSNREPNYFRFLIPFGAGLHTSEHREVIPSNRTCFTKSHPSALTLNKSSCVGVWLRSNNSLLSQLTQFWLMHLQRYKFSTLTPQLNYLLRALDLEPGTNHLVLGDIRWLARGSADAAKELDVSLRALMLSLCDVKRPWRASVMLIIIPRAWIPLLPSAVTWSLRPEPTTGIC